MQRHAFNESDINDINNLMNELSFDKQSSSFLSQVVKVQSWIRMKLAKQSILIPSSKYQTKKWRKSRNWYLSGK